MARALLLVGVPVIVSVIWIFLGKVELPFSGYVSASLTAVAALVAIVRDTWDNSKEGMNKLTTTGFIALYVLAGSFTVTIHGEVERQKKVASLLDRCCQRTGMAILKILTPYRLLAAVDLNKRFPELVLDHYKDKKLLQALDNLDLTKAPDLKGRHPSSIFDVQLKDAFIQGKWFEIIQQNTLAGVKELSECSLDYQKFMKAKDLELYDKVISHDFLNPLKSLDAQHKRGDVIDVNTSEFTSFVEDVLELKRRFDFTQCLDKGGGPA